MSTNLDLGDPVALTNTIINDNFSHTAVEVVTGAERGGYSGLKPLIRPVEGKAGRKTQAEIDVYQIKAKAMITIYEVSYVETVESLFGNYNDITARISIDIRMAISKAKLVELDNEIRRIIMIYRSTSPGGNWDYIKQIQRTDLTNRKRGLYRYVRDIEFVKVSDYVGHE